MNNKIIFYELNEVPYRILDYYVKKYPQSNFAKYLPFCDQFQSETEEKSSLSPWITWPSVHRGVNDEKHMIVDFGQNLEAVDKEYPPIWRLLSQKGVKVGVFGSLHSAPAPKSFENYDFYVPDIFAADATCFPEHLEPFQDLCLSMARESARNVSTRLPWNKALAVLKNLPSYGFKPKTIVSVAKQLMNERQESWKKVRRRSFQTLIAFDVFLKQLKSTRPDFVTFFTNHVASSMHRYWGALFPQDYSEGSFEKDWSEQYKHEIDFTMELADYLFGELVKFAQKDKRYKIVLSTSMGQEAIVSSHLETQLYLVELDRFMSHLGFVGKWSKKPAMLPQVCVAIDSDSIQKFEDVVKSIDVHGHKISYRKAEDGFFALDFGFANLHDKDKFALVNGKKTSYEELGLKVVEIEDKSGTSAYHIPQGILLVFDPKKNAAKLSRVRNKISTLDIAPAILRNFNVHTPGYMAAPQNIL